MKDWHKTALIIAILALPPGGVLIYGLIDTLGRSVSEPDDSQSYTKLDWKKLRGLDLETGAGPSDLLALNGKRVQIPGFIVPLDDDAASYSEFLLVPSPQACIHVPPPPANQMVMVKMAADQAPKRSYNPIWIKGRLIITTVESQFGKVSYRLDGEGTETYTAN